MWRYPGRKNSWKSYSIRRTPNQELLKEMKLSKSKWSFPWLTFPIYNIRIKNIENWVILVVIEVDCDHCSWRNHTLLIENLFNKRWISKNSGEMNSWQISKPQIFLESQSNGLSTHVNISLDKIFVFEIDLVNLIEKSCFPFLQIESFHERSEQRFKRFLFTLINNWHWVIRIMGFSLLDSSLNLWRTMKRKRKRKWRERKEESKASSSWRLL